MYSNAFNILLLKMSLSRQNAVQFPYGRTRETLSLFSIFIFMASFQEGEEQRKSWHSMFHDREQEIEEKSLECEMCFKKFSQKGKLKLHILTHTLGRKISFAKCEIHSTKSFKKTHTDSHRGKIFYLWNIFQEFWSNWTFTKTSTDTHWREIFHMWKMSQENQLFTYLTKASTDTY